MSGLLVGRLAPSPTGAQHVGNARTYLLAWLSIRSRGGCLILRIEDIDSPRIKSWATQQAIDDLKWLGLDWDAGPDCGGPHEPYIQTQRTALYHDALERLKQANRIYPCTCTRTDVAAAASAPHIGQEGPIYPGTCAVRSASDADELDERPFAWRFRTNHQSRQCDSSEMSNGLSQMQAEEQQLAARMCFTDLLAGPQTCCLSTDLGDFVVGKKNGSIAYQLAVVVDDHAMGVTEVIRGDDLIPSAFRQLALYESFGWNAPQFGHCPLVVGPDGRRLAKRHGDTRLSVLRERGLKSDRLVGWLAYSLGLQSTPQPITARELLSDFSLDRVRAEQLVLTDTIWAALQADEAIFDNLSRVKPIS